MKPQFSPKSAWLWLALVSTALLAGIVSIEVGVLHPKLLRYFDNTGTLTDEPLALRSREHLLKALSLLQEPRPEQQTEQAQHELDMAYGLLNISLYTRQYPCTSEALIRIDQLHHLLKSSATVDQAAVHQTMLPAFQCTNAIEKGQNSKRSDLAREIVASLDTQRRIFLWTTFLIVTAGIVLFGVHRQQLRIIADSRRETDKWIRHAMRDELTGIYNRRAFDADLRRHLKEHKETGKSFSLLMCDVDYFKQYNDSMGHPAGDKALQYITQSIMNMLRGSDSLYRYGGEELIVLLDNTDKLQAQNVARRALNQVRNLQLPHPSTELGYLTISIGCASSEEIEDCDEDIVELVDKQLYKAKQSGRNRLACAVD